MASEGSLLSFVGERLNSRDGVLALERCTMAGSTASAQLGRSPQQSMSYTRGCSSVTAILSGLGPELQVAGWLFGSKDEFVLHTNIQANQPPVRHRP